MRRFARVGLARRGLTRTNSTVPHIPGLSPAFWSNTGPSNQRAVLESVHHEPLSDDDFESMLVPLLQRVSPSGSVLVALSGGVDSLALASLTARWASRAGRAVSAVVVDHGLRPESSQEAERVVSISESLGMPCRVLTLGWGTSSPRSAASLPQWAAQAAARQGRHAALHAAAVETGASVVLLGHHQDDAVETTLLRVFRMSGVAGLAGMAQQSSVHGVGGASVPSIRPLLHVPKARVVATSSSLGLLQQVQWDPSNDSDRYDRNRVRRGLRLSKDSNAPSIEPSQVLAFSHLFATAREVLLDEARVIAASGCVTMPDSGLTLIEPTKFVVEQSPPSCIRAGSALMEAEVKHLALSNVLSIGGRDSPVWRPAEKAVHEDLALELSRLPPGGRRSLSQGVIAETLVSTDTTSLCAIVTLPDDASRKRHQNTTNVSDTVMCIPGSEQHVSFWSRFQVRTWRIMADPSWSAMDRIVNRQNATTPPMSGKGSLRQTLRRFQPPKEPAASGPAPVNPRLQRAVSLASILLSDPRGSVGVVPLTDADCAGQQESSPPSPAHHKMAGFRDVDIHTFLQPVHPLAKLEPSDSPTTPSSRGPAPGSSRRAVGEPYVLMDSTPPSHPSASALDDARKLRDWVTESAHAAHDRLSLALLQTVQEAIDRSLTTRAELSKIIAEHITRAACQTPALAVRTLSTEAWSCVRDILNLPCQPFLLSSEWTVGAAIVFALVSPSFDVCSVTDWCDGCSQASMCPPWSLRETSW
jgi:tRNA(Ile)-lysidine synthetase-like protein